MKNKVVIKPKVGSPLMSSKATRQGPQPFEHPVYITRPLLPNLGEVQTKLKEIWDSQILTNGGQQHILFETALQEFLGVRHLSLFCNGTLALSIAVHALRLTGEVITTPFTFPATPHVLHWNNIRPVFCDINPNNLTLDLNQIESLITPLTTAILPVHVFGIPCDVQGLQQIADRHGLKLVYDAAHAFGVQVKGQPIGSYGDAAMFSFHATKLFHTLEGGALSIKNPELKTRVDSLKNFGIKNEEEVIGPGINGKMNEIQAAIGLLVLKMVDAEIIRRSTLYQYYRERLGAIDGLSIPSIPEGVRSNYQYMPLLIDDGEFGSSRDQVYTYLRRYNVFARKYFYPLCSQYACYRGLWSSSPNSLPVAERVSRQILCLPLFGQLSRVDVERICDLVLASRDSRPENS